MQLRPGRFVAMILIVVLVLGAYVVQLMKYQLVDGSGYRTLSAKTTKSATTIAAPRGEILDRYGRRIATNRVGFAVSFNYSFLPKAKENSIILAVTKILTEDGEQWTDTLPISKTAPFTYLDTTDADLNRFFSTTSTDKSLSAPAAMQKLVSRYGIDTKLSDADKRTIAGIRYEMETHNFSIYNAYDCATDVGMTTVSKISERYLDLPGVEINQEPIRVYPDGTMAPHIIGTISPIYSEEYTTLKKQGYSMNDLIGRSGVEQSMESYLRGTDGEKTIELNKYGKVVKEQVTQPALPGDTVVLTIDTNMQKQLQAMLPSVIQSIVQSSKGDPTYGANANSGAAVVLDVKTGEVLAMASYPSYDLNSYYQNYTQLLHQSGNPLYNRCLSGTYRPGSTYKPVVATAALMYHAITPETTFVCNGKIYRFGQTFNCDGVHGAEQVVGAIRDSCNVFFYNAGYLATIKNIDTTATALGLGQKTGIELKGEAAGVLSGPEEKLDRGAGTWNPGDTLQSSIGQFDNKFTLLQLANYVSTLVNGGTRHQVHLVREVLSYDYSKTIISSTPKVLSKTAIPSDVLKTVMTGMQKVTEEGTGQSVFQGYRMQVGGKTGTAQVPGGYNGLFVGYAPADNPQIAVAVVVEHGHNGYQTAPVARAMFDNYFFSGNNVSSPVNDNTLLK